MNDFVIFGGSAHPSLTKKVCSVLDAELGASFSTQFSDGETRVEIQDSARGKDVFIIQPTCSPVNDTFMELCIMVDAFKRASARSITAVIPYFGYARQDKKVKPREPITARMVCDFLKVAGVQRIMTVDVHSEQMQGFFDGPFDHLYAGPIFVDYCKSQNFVGDQYVVVSPDVSGGSRAQNLAKHLDCDFAVIKKSRPEPNVVVAGKVMGDVRGKRVILLDDMIDTAGTAIAAAELLEKDGAECGYLAFTHGVLSGPGVQRINNCQFIKEVICTDTIPVDASRFSGTFTQLSVAPLIANAIQRHQSGESVSGLFSDWRA
jgi:ribose-phosphate pyrophosphokinase